MPEKTHTNIAKYQETRNGHVKDLKLSYIIVLQTEANLHSWREIWQKFLIKKCSRFGKQVVSCNQLEIVLQALNSVANIRRLTYIFAEKKVIEIFVIQDDNPRQWILIPICHHARHSVTMTLTFTYSNSKYEKVHPVHVKLTYSGTMIGEICINQ